MRCATPIRLGNADSGGTEETPLQPTLTAGLAKLRKAVAEISLFPLIDATTTTQAASQVVDGLVSSRPLAVR
jgi:hypothetical protein